MKSRLRPHINHFLAESVNQLFMPSEAVYPACRKRRLLDSYQLQLMVEVNDLWWGFQLNCFVGFLMSEN